MRCQPGPDLRGRRSAVRRLELGLLLRQRTLPRANLSQRPQREARRHLLDPAPHEPAHAFRPVAAGRPLRQSPECAATPAVRAGPDAAPGAGRGRVVRGPVGRRFCRIHATVRSVARAAAQPGAAFRRTGCPGHQGHREDHQPRRQGSGDVDQGPHQRPSRTGACRRIRALCLHQRRHQQHQPRPDAAGHPHPGLVARTGQAAGHARPDGPRPGWAAHVEPHAWADRQPDHGGQGSGQRGRAAGPRAGASPPCRCWPR